MRQTIRYLSASDGVRLAWATAGSGPALVRAANWLTHLQYDLESPVWRHWVRFFATHFRFIRYDERGCGMTQWDVGDLSMPRWVDDLELVVDAASNDEPVNLLGISQGAATAIAYAVRHPRRVRRLILYGGLCTGARHRTDADGRRLFEAIVELVRHGWGSDNPSFRQVFVSRFVPGASPEQLEWLTELCRHTTSAANAVRLLQVRSDVDVRPLLAEVRVPTLVLHAARDEVIPLDQSREIAAGIPDAEFVELDSRNHILLEHEPAWRRFMDAVREFTGPATGAAGADPRFDTLSARERQVLGALAAGHSNAEIGTGLHISEKTVRNMLTRIFGKLGVRSRAQAIVLARDGGFAGS